jgi:hypothetical protein
MRERERDRERGREWEREKVSNVWLLKISIGFLMISKITTN